MTVEKVKKLVFPDHEPTAGQLELLDEVDALVRQRLLGILGGLMHKPPDEVPSELEYIVVEVDIKRFNRIGAEGLQKEVMGSNSATYEDKGDFDDYLDELAAWAAKQDDDDLRNKKVVHFL